MRVFVLLCLCLLLVGCVFADDPCIVQFPSGNHVDLKLLTQETYFKTEGNGLVFYINICETAKFSCDGKEYPSSVDVGFGCLGASSNNEVDIETTVIGEKDDTPSLYLKYKNGAKDGTQHVLTTQIKISCDTNPEGKDVFSFISDQDVSASERLFSFELASPKACYTPSGGDFIVGAGGIIIIIVIACLAVYFAIGAIVQVVRVKKFGLELESKWHIIPNFKFWKALPFLFKDGILLVVEGCKAVVSKAKKGKGGSTENYESV